MIKRTNLKIEMILPKGSIKLLALLSSLFQNFVQFIYEKIELIKPLIEGAVYTRKSHLIKVFVMLRTLIFLTLVSALFNTELVALDNHTKGNLTISSSINELLGEQDAVKYKAVMPVNLAIDWQIYVPESYDPNLPAGVLVYISPSNSAIIPPSWKSLMAKHNLIWIAAKHSGNNVSTVRRMTYALLGYSIIKSKYTITEQRVYVSGFSGGGRVASILASEYPHLFKGAIYNSGVNFWNDKTPDIIQQIKNNRYVFITGQNDFNLDDTKQVYRKYKAAGVKNIKLMVNIRQGHSNPKKSHYDKALIFLDDES